MGASYYVHNVIGQLNVGSIYAQEKIQQQLQYQSRQLNAIQDSIKNKYNNLFQDTSDYTSLMENLEKTLSDALLPELVKDLPTISFQGIRQGIISANNAKNGSIEPLEKAIKKMQKDIEKYEKLYETCERVATRKRGKRWISQEQLNILYKDRERIRQAKEQVEKLLTADGVEKWGLSAAAGRTISIVAGLMSEYALTDLLNKQFLKSGKYNLGNGLSLTVSQVGTKGSTKTNTGYKVGTADIQLSVTNNKGEVVINLPSISLKRTSSGTGKIPKYNVHIKSTSIQKIIELGGLENSSFDLETFYNAYANHMRQTHTMPGGEPIMNKVININQMYKAFHMAALLTALTGSLNIEDFAYYLVINDKLFTATDILNMAMGGQVNISAGLLSAKGKDNIDKILSGSQNTSLSRAQPSIVEAHNRLFQNLKDPDRSDSAESQQRSSEIIRLINGLTLTLNLNISLTNLI